MIGSWAILAFSVGYVGLLFAIAYYGDRQAKARGRPASRPFVYALSLAVYCTSWTFYGSVGLAAKTGYNFLPIYVGPILMFAVGWPLVRRIIRISKRHNITSIADFIAARYGKSPRLAAAVAVIALIGTLPYIALQLKAVSTSFAILMNFPRLGIPLAGAGPSIWGDTALIVSVILALFAILFGTRHIDATEHNEGMILAIAFESLVKLLAFLVVGGVVTWSLFGGLHDLASRVTADPRLRQVFLSGIDGPTWVTMTGLAMLAILCLPRQFHMTVVESVDERDVRRAAWLFPLYLVAINVFVVPIAAAGLIQFPNGTIDADMFVVALPIAGGHQAVALLAFIGGLSAATAMVIVESIAVSNMVSNDLVMPIVLHGRRLGLAEREDMGTLILNVRRIAILGSVLLAYCYYKLVGDTFALASIGLLSFAAMAQFAPALLGGLAWRGATEKGAFAGILAGFGVWAYTLLLPSLVRSGWLPLDFLVDGPFGIGLLRPEQLFGLRFDPLSHGVFWSLLANVTTYVVVSVLSVPKLIERIQASAFVDSDTTQGHFGSRPWHESILVGDLAALVSRYLGAERAQRSFAEWGLQRGLVLDPATLAESGLVRETERLLASAIGAPSARLVMALTLERRSLGTGAAMDLLDDASAAIQYNRDILQSTLENVRQGISVFDQDLKLAFWNRHFRDLLELPPEFARVGVTLQEIIRFDATRSEHGPGGIDALVAERLELFVGAGDTVFQRRRPDGTVLEIRTNPLPGGGYVTTYSDITAHVQATAELAAANERLEERVRERTAALTQLNAELTKAKIVAEEANLGKTRFLAAASHDLLQPLNAARLYVSSLIERQAHTGAQDRAGAELARKVDASLMSVEELLGTLLDISRLDAGALTPERRHFPLGELLDALKIEFAPLAERKGLDLRIAQTALAVESDRRLLHRLLQNLLSNAIRYTTQGEVLMSTRHDGDYIVIQVADTGIGIPAEKHALMFQEFQRFSRGPGIEHGLGLGLSIVDRIGRMLDHPVTFRSDPGRGTTFIVRVPRGDAAAVACRPEVLPPRTLPVLAHTLVLCVDNDVTVLDGMKTLLEGWACRVLLATGADQAMALAQAEQRRPDLLVVDYHLDSSGDGVQCIERLRGAYAAKLPAILITADRLEAVKTLALEHGLPVLNKPVKPAALRALMMRLLAAPQAAE
ncbi:MAG: PAS-domain containing protein [Alphaproteobacteria bacterium]|nr:PAS-domain containing protein [Alphaproteobacteria bacterium]